MPPLPGELIFPILEKDYFNHKYRPDRRFLLNCCLVSKSWAAEAQPLLFRHVEVRRPSAFEGLKAALTQATSRRGPLKDYVLWLRIWIGYNSSASPPETLLFLLRTCPNLYGLSVTLQSMRPDTGIVLPPNIRALECCDWEGDPVWSWGASRDIIRSGWDSIRFLTLRGFVVTGPLELPPNLIGLRLDESLNACHLAKSDDAPWPSLRFLDVRPSDAGQVLGIFNQSLESLHLSHRPFFDLFFQDLSRCERLREFRFDGPLRQSMIDDLIALPLEHLAFVAPHREAWLLRDRSLEGILLLQHLRVISCLTPPRPWDWHMTLYMNELQKICAEKTIRLDVYADLVEFRVFTRGDQILSDTFPRGHTVLNYSRLYGQPL